MSTLLQRFVRHVDFTTCCWLWIGCTLPPHGIAAGYGQFNMNGKTTLAHRAAYELIVGPIPLPTLDHLCRTRNCVNPDHLEPVTQQENIQRGTRRITHCPSGHEYTPENTRIVYGYRRCRTCHRAGMKKVA